MEVYCIINYAKRMRGEKEKHHREIITSFQNILNFSSEIIKIIREELYLSVWKENCYKSQHLPNKTVVLVQFSSGKE